MFRKSLTIALLAVSLVVSPLSSFADEGMWLPDSLNKLPLGEMKKRGFELKPEDVYSTTKPSLKDAIVQISIGGTGSFVSPDGLILTNHHVAFAAVTRASTTEKDYINNGFLAASRAEEIPAQGYTISVTQDFKDVTADVTAAVKPEMTPEERTRAIAVKQQEIAKAAAAGREKEGIRTQVVEASGGYQYFLYTYLTLKDVRLAYAPPKSIGYFGGDPDNFEWPRHCGDFAFLRAYTAPDGSAAAFSKDNVPFKPKKFLPINATGIKEGDFAMVMGYPGATYRLRESYSVEYRQNIQLPDQIATLRQQIDVLTKLGDKDPALRIKYADQIFSLSNSLKAFEGAVAGLKRMNLVPRKRAEEAAMQKWLDANAALKAKYGDVLANLGTLYGELTAISAKQNALNALLSSGDLINALQFAYERATSRDLPANERAPQFSDQFLPQVTTQLSAGWEEREPESESRLLAAALARVDELPAGQKIQAVEKSFEGKSGKERRAAESEFARKAIEQTKFKSFDEVKKLFSASAAELRAIDDPALKLVIAAVDENAPLNKKQTQILGSVTKIRPLYVASLVDFRQATNRGLPYYPDANFTLRFTYGDIRGYKPRDAVIYEPQTTLSGVIAKDTGEEPFNVPEKLKELYKKKDFNGYVDQRLNDVPVDFLATTDITGGNSGSPMMNGRGEIIGLVFDGNYEGLGGDYAYDISLNRTIAVDIRYVLFVLEKFAGANYLSNEMTVKRPKAMAASK
ncbi:MAG: Dipeptidyl aminopeptidase BII [Acidobacteria bacterium]|nr:Dipeptidyl aminopeptidase BII [Acidobacteriota bacterium]